jgi:hypothetical protein
MTVLETIPNDGISVLTEKIFPSRKGSKPQPLRKLSLIKDKESKTRIIAILDY